MSSDELSPFSGSRLLSAGAAASLGAAREAVDAWWARHRDALPPEHREFFRHLVEQSDLCLRLAAQAMGREETRGATEAGGRPPGQARRGAEQVESAGWIDLVSTWERAAAAMTRAAPGPAPSPDADEAVHRCWRDYREALGEYLTVLRSMSEKTIGEALEASAAAHPAAHEQPLHALYERLVEKGEARYLAVATSEHYAKLQGRLVNSLLRLKRAQQPAQRRR